MSDMAKSIFDSEIKGLMDTLPKVARLADRVFSSMERDINRVRRTLDGLSGKIKLSIDTSAVEKVTTSVNHLQERLNKFVNTKHTLHIVTKEGGSDAEKSKSGLGKILGRGLGTVVSAGASLLDKGVDLMASSIQIGLEADKQRTGLGMLIGKEKGNNVYNSIQQSSRQTGFKTTDIVASVRPLLIAGRDAGNAKNDIWYAMNAMNATGNRGNTANLQIVGDTMARMASAGSVSGDDLKELEHAGVPATKILSDYMGVPQEKVADHHVNYNTVAAALERASESGGLFAGAMDEQSRTIGGRWDMILGFWETGVQNLLNNSSLQNSITVLEDDLLGLMDGFGETAQFLGNGLSMVADRFHELMPSLKDAGSALIHNVVAPLGKFVMGDNMAKLTKNLIDFSAAILNSPFIQKLMEGLSWVLDTVAGVLAKCFGWLKDGVNWVSGLFEDKPEIKVGNRSTTNNLTPQESQKNLNLLLGKPYAASPLAPVPLQAPVSLPPAKLDHLPGHYRANDVSSAIAGGGEKLIVINVKSFAEHFNVNVQSVKESGREVKEVFERMFLEVLMSANAAM